MGRTIKIALIQFDAVPEQTDANLQKMKILVQTARKSGAKWIMFHEGAVCDYSPDLRKYAEPVPYGSSTKYMAKLAKTNDCYINFGLSESENDRYYITQVFLGPDGFIYRYRKTWIWREQEDKGYRNEWARYDVGTGPELFNFDGVLATCFICADGEAPRCIERAKLLKPQIVFYPNNREVLPDFGPRAKEIGAPMLVTNRVGKSWIYDCKGGCFVYSSSGEVLAKSNTEGREEILIFDLNLTI
ncbi:MAG: carbon-nitrogen hydrolase family protein [Candidatus Omnitrophica bacterium]|nr:carbon-nitrogen hydrolase family protein [Candidatus Omnitrophota bacterium]